MPYKCRRHRTTSSNLVQLDKNNAFVAQSISSVYSSKIKITPDGQQNVQRVSSIKERHLRAEPELPTLEERATMSNNKNLLKLSQQLAEVNEDDRGDGKHKQNNIFLNENRRDKSNNKHCADTDRDGDKCQNSKKPKIKQLTRRKGRGSSLQEVLTHDSVRNYIKKQVRLMTLKRYAEGNECDCESPKKKEDRPIEKQDDVSTVGNKLSEIHVTPRTKTTLRQVKMFIDKGTGPIEEAQFLKPVNLKLKNLGSKKLSGSTFDKILHIIDKFHIYTLLLHLALFAYLIYILFIDISQYVNEEKRYLAKIRSSNLPLKFFYYLMHFLNVDLF